jgi:hypothetical protein
MNKYRNVRGLVVGAIFFLTINLALIAQEQDAPKELYSAGLANVSEYRIPSLISTPNGTLIALVDARKDRRGDIPNNVDLAIRRSVDGGETWGPVQIIVDYITPKGYDIPWGVADAHCIHIDMQTDIIVDWPNGQETQDSFYLSSSWPFPSPSA